MLALSLPVGPPVLPESLASVAVPAVTADALVIVPADSPTVLRTRRKPA
ncbi:hypothetical protein [Nannocystis exedens]|nr:hypothetical protein [Nannocystis exedens]